MPPETPNGVITHYSVQYNGRRINNFGSITVTKMMGIVEGLSPNTEYLIQLRAHTRVGGGPSASLTVKTGKLLLLQWKSLVHVLQCIILLDVVCYIMNHDGEP